MPNLSALDAQQLKQELAQASSAEKKTTYLIEIAYRQTNQRPSEHDMGLLIGILLQVNDYNIDEVNHIIKYKLSPVSSMIAMVALHLGGHQKEIFIPQPTMEAEYLAFSEACGIPASVLSKTPEYLKRTELHEKYMQASSPEAKLPYAIEITYRSTGRMLNKSELYAVRLALSKPTSEIDEAIGNLPPSSQRAVQMVRSNAEPQEQGAVAQVPVNAPARQDDRTAPRP